MQIESYRELLLLHGDFNQPIKKGDIPSHINALSIGNQYEQVLENSVLPDSITELYISYEIKQSLTSILSMVPNIKRLSLIGINQPIIKGDIPYGVTFLHYDSKNHYIEHGALPNSITELWIDNLATPFRDEYNIPLIPSSVTKLILRSELKSQIEIGDIPNGVTSLEVPADYKLGHKIPVPESLTKIVFGTGLYDDGYSEYEKGEDRF